MAETVEFLLKMNDQVSGPAKSASSQIDKLAESNRRLARQLETLDKKDTYRQMVKAQVSANKDAMASIRSHMRQSQEQSEAQKAQANSTRDAWLTAHSQLSVVGSVLSTIGGAAIGAASAVGQIAFQFSKAGVEALAFRESTIASFDLMLGKGKGGKMFDLAAQFGKITPFETEDVVNSFQSLSSAGFGEKEIPIVFQALGDVAAAAGMDKGVLPSLALQMSQVKAAGKLQMVDLRVMVGQMGKAGVGLRQVYDMIGKNMGIGSTEVADAMEKGKISADVGIFSILEAIKARTGELGKVMETQSKTVRGLFSTLASVPKDIFITKAGSFAEPFKKGYDTFKGLLENLVAMTSRPIFQRLQLAAASAFNTMMSLLGPLTGSKGLERLESFATKLLNAFDSMWGGFKAGALAAAPGLMAMVSSFGKLMGIQDTGAGIGQIFEMMGVAVGKTAGAIALLADSLSIVSGAISTVLAKLTEKFEGLRENVFNPAAWFEVGVSAISGLLKGLASVTPIGAAVGIAEKVIGAVRGPQGFDSKSPSRKFFEIGQDVGDGLALGMSQMTAMDSARSMVGDTGGSLAVSRGGGNTIQVNLTITPPDSNDPRSFGERVRDVLVDQLPAAFEQLAEQGA